MKKKRILILSGSTGGGHVSAALSLENCAAKSFSSELEVIHIDIIEHMSKVFKKIYADSYNNIIINSPKLYGYLYSMTDHNKDDKSKFILTKMRYYFEEFFALKLKKIIKKLAPDVIICTHFLPAEHLNNAAKDGKFANKYCVVITDYDVHWLWAQKNMDMFFVATEEEAERLIDKGINSEKIHITGIPIKPDFAVEYDKKETRRKLGLHEDKKTLLIMTGAYGAGRIQEFMEYFMRNVKEDFQAVLITGKNKELFRSLRKYHKEYPNKIKLIRFTKEVHKYMAASDFILSKTGGLTTSECIAMGLPVITVNPIPGQEDRNTNYLLENNACLKAYDFIGVTYRIRKLLSDDKLLKKMQDNAKNISKPNAAYDILKLLIEK